MSLGNQTDEVQAEGDLFGQAHDARGVVRRARAGRPAGSVNRRTKETVEYILGKFGDPLINLAEMNALDVPNLAKALGCKKLDAAKLLLEVNSRLAKYVHSQRPTAVIARVEDVAHVTLNVPGFEDFDEAANIFEVNPTKTITYDDDAPSVAQDSVAPDA